MNCFRVVELDWEEIKSALVESGLISKAECFKSSLDIKIDYNTGISWKLPQAPTEPTP